MPRKVYDEKNKSLEELGLLQRIITKDVCILGF